MNIILSGAGGFIGRAVRHALTSAGHTVTPLVRRPPKPGEIFWDPQKDTISASELEGAEGVIHLSGEPIVAGRWTHERKRRIEDSRVKGTTFLSNTLAKLSRPPSVFLCASALGYYGDRGSETLSEASLPGTGFLSQVCLRWEAATEPARKKGIRVLSLRFGLVLDRAGGALAAMLPAFRFALGGPIGTGNQYWSWIDLTDLVSALVFAIEHPNLQGPLNITAPTPRMQKEFASALGAAMQRPAFLPLPAFAARLLLGEMAQELLLCSTRALPMKLQKAGFTFNYPTLESSLARLFSLRSAERL